MWRRSSSGKSGNIGGCATAEIEQVFKGVGIDGQIVAIKVLHQRLGKIMWDKCGMARSREGLEDALERIPAIRDEFWNNVRIPGNSGQLNQELEKAGRVADFLEFAEVLCHDALDREESCGGHFRVEHQFRCYR